MKTEVYSWRLSAELKADLEERARQERKSLSALLQEFTSAGLRARRNGHSHNEAAEQAAIRRRARKAIGACSGGDPTASERSRELVQEIVYRKHLKELNGSSHRVSRRAD